MSEVTWLPQPAEWRELALDAQQGVEGSTYELYRQALQLRRENRLGLGSLEWLEDARDDVLAFVNDGVLVLANTGNQPVDLPAGAEVLLLDVATDLDTALRTRERERQL